MHSNGRGKKRRKVQKQKNNKDDICDQCKHGSERTEFDLVVDSNAFWSIATFLAFPCIWLVSPRVRLG
jgi:hypothetical protein